MLETDDFTLSQRFAHERGDDRARGRRHPDGLHYWQLSITDELGDELLRALRARPAADPRP